MLACLRDAGRDGGILCLSVRDATGVFGLAAAIRASRHIALEDIAHTTKISLIYLRAIERGQMDVLPGGIYNISYLKQYAKAIDFDAGALLSAYRRAQELAAPGQPFLAERLWFGFDVLLRRLIQFVSAVVRPGPAA